MCNIIDINNVRGDYFTSQSFCDSCEVSYVLVHQDITMTRFNCPVCYNSCIIEDLFLFNLFVNILKLKSNNK